MALLVVLAGCAQPPRVPLAAGEIRSEWTGRLSLRIESDPVQAFHAGFDLKGNAQRGDLSLFSPLGSTVGRLEWSPGAALLRWNGEQRSFDSINDLTRVATGTELPIASLFQWLSGRQTTGDGWAADLQQLGDGKIVARRQNPAPVVEMRLIFE